MRVDPPAPMSRTRALGQWLAQRPLVLLATVLLIWGLTDVRSRGQISAVRPGLHRTDFTVYTEAGAAFFDGRDPYAVTNPRGWGYLYPPLFAILVAPLHALDPQLQVVVWFLLNLLLGWAAWGECRRLLRLTTAAEEPATSTLPRWLALATIASAALPALNCLQRGQVGVLKLYLLLLGLRLLLESRSWAKALAAGAAFAAAIALKVTPALPVGLIAADQILAALRAGVGARCRAGPGRRKSRSPRSARAASGWASPPGCWPASS